jgi:hypothetical protein
MSGTPIIRYWDGKGFVAGFMRPKGYEKNIYESSEQKEFQ